MKFRYVLPFLFFGIFGAYSQEKDSTFAFEKKSSFDLQGSVFKLDKYAMDIMNRKFSSSEENGFTDIVKYELDSGPRNGKFDMNVFFRVNWYNAKDGGWGKDSTAVEVWKDFDEDGKPDYIIRDSNGDGFLDEVLFDRRLFPGKDKNKSRFLKISYLENLFR